MKLTDISTIIAAIVATIPNTLYLRATDSEANITSDNLDLAGKVVVLFNNLPDITFNQSKSGYTYGEAPIEIKVLKLAQFEDLEVDSDTLRDECAAIAHTIYQSIPEDDQPDDGVYAVRYLGETKVYDKILTGCSLTFLLTVEVVDYTCTT